ncbi:MFS transporter [Streptomyces anthocyanicus]|uniref:MDR family MFS transporter n=1 Tax=Streptomyces anthocyanicus TaxID=68174 RepID=UPI00166FA5AF|nr:MFS transporter [Streptomyces anthocyanicus]GGL27465.1 MFS transporter [Streptomyces anthocyanicus]
MISLGLPRIPQRGRIFSSVFIDTFGWGLFAPLAFLYFSYNTGLSFSAIGSAVSAGTLAALPTALLAGWLVDRFSPKAMLVSSNLVTALGYGLYPFASEWTLIAVATFLVMAGDRLYWASWPVIVVDLASGRKLDATYAAVGTIKNFTVATGALASSGLTVVLGHGAADLVLALNVVTSLVAAVLLAGVRIPATRPGPEPGATEEEQENPGRPAPGWRDAFTDHAFTGFCFFFMLLTFAWALPSTILPAYAVEIMELPDWTPALFLGINSVAIMLAQMPVTARVSHVPRQRLIVRSGLIFVVVFTGLYLVTKVPATTAIVVLVPVMLTFTLGEMISLPAANALVASSAPAAIRGRYMSLFQLSWAVSGLFIPLLAGFVLDRGALWVCAAFGGIALLAAIGIQATAYRIAPADRPGPTPRGAKTGAPRPDHPSDEAASLDPEPSESTRPVSTKDVT